MRFYYYLTVLLFITLSTDSFTQEIKWISLEDAVYLQEAAPRNIIIDMYTNWCGPCKLLDRNTFANKDIDFMSQRNHLWSFEMRNIRSHR